MEFLRWGGPTKGESLIFPMGFLCFPNTPNEAFNMRFHLPKTNTPSHLLGGRAPKGRPSLSASRLLHGHPLHISGTHTGTIPILQGIQKIGVGVRGNSMGGLGVPRLLGGSLESPGDFRKFHFSALPVTSPTAAPAGSKDTWRVAPGFATNHEVVGTNPTEASEKCWKFEVTRIMKNDVPQNGRKPTKNGYLDEFHGRFGMSDSPNRRHFFVGNCPKGSGPVGRLEALPAARPAGNFHPSSGHLFTHFWLLQLSTSIPNTGWWLSFNPFEKYYIVKMGDFLPQFSGWK